MAAICEVHNEEELEKVLKTDWEIIWINNRNLKTFEIDLQTTLDLAKKIPKWKIIISESWIYDFLDTKKVAPVANWILVWTSIMQAKSRGLKIKELKWQKIFKACWIRKKLKSYEWIDLLWFNFVPSSKRVVSLVEASEILEDCRDKKTFVSTVGLFQNQSIEEVLKISKDLNFNFVQLHWDENLSYCKKIKEAGFWLIKVFKVNENLKEKIQEFLPERKNYSSENLVDYFIFDSWDWSWKTFDSKLLNWIEVPYILAGWVKPENVEELLKNHPFAIWVDSASWVENEEKANISEERVLEIYKKLN